MNKQELINKITEANIAYRTGQSIISDKEYDEFIERLESLAKNHPLLREIGIKVIERKEKLPFNMFSLDKLKNEDEFKCWFMKYAFINEEFIITPKLDGISLLVNEKLCNCWTRGDGYEGQRSDNHFLCLEKKSNNIDREDFTCGEAIILRESISDLNKQRLSHNKEPFKNTRNGVAGIFNTDDISTEMNYVRYIRYNMFNHNFSNKSDLLDYLNEHYNTIKIPYLKVKLNDLKSSDFDSLYQEWSKEYDIDGLVIEINNIDTQNKMGREKNNNPRYSRAIKFNFEEVKETTVVDFEINISKNGYLKPVLIVKPTELSGVTVNRVTAYNWKFVKSNNITIGSVIRIKRSGDVIPKVVDIVSNNVNNIMTTYFLFSTCPDCFSKTEDDGVEKKCINDKCKGKKISQLSSFFEILCIEEFGRPTIERLYINGYDNEEKILSITKEELIKNIDGFAEKSAEKLTNQFKLLLENGVQLAKLMHASNIFNNIGEKTIQVILDELNYENIQNLISNIYFYPNLEERLLKINGIGEITAKEFSRGINKFFKKDSYYLSEFIKISKIIEKKQEATNNKYEGKNFCFSGFRDNKIETNIIAGSGKISLSIGNETTHLIVKDKSKKSSKIEKAKKNNIIILNIEEFLSL